MPYRRLPNTDSSRLKALEKALQKGKKIPPFNLAFSQNSYQKVQSFLPIWQKSIIENNNTYNIQIKNNKDYLIKLKKAKLYISHFIQVINMAIVRGELSENIKENYNLPIEEKKIPALNTENEILYWGEKIISGETKRKMQGHSPISNPTIAVVKVHYDNFMEAYKFQKTLKRNHGRTLQNIASLRKDADDIILKIWNDVEAYYNELPEEQKRIEAQKYGIIYIYRKNEIGKIQLLKDDFTTDY
ncbi:MAG: hypothetical protein PF487_09770 [Bacteroidales bacterium]|jgi:hypothetical protein|nr:hypothetical protein [Bacteroidales bacterium]